MPEHIITTSALAKHGLIALFGAVVHALNAHRQGKAKGFIEILIFTVIASFSGVMFGLVAVYFFGFSYITLAITGAGIFWALRGFTRSSTP
jgi:hypothetical protein